MSRLGAETAKDDMNRRRNLGFFFDQSVARRPDKVAIIDLFGGRERRATYRQLDERMNGVASMLARLGVVPGERVAMLIGNRTEFVEFFFGSMRAGAIPLPLNTRLAAGTLDEMSATRAFCPSRRKWQSPRSLSIRLRLPTMRKHSNPIRRDRPAAPRARS